MGKTLRLFREGLLIVPCRSATLRIPDFPGGPVLCAVVGKLAVDYLVSVSGRVLTVLWPERVCLGNGGCLKYQQECTCNRCVLTEENTATGSFVTVIPMVLSCQQEKFKWQ